MTNLTLKQPALALALLGTSLVLGACGPTNNPDPKPATQPTTISGTLVPFVAGTADNITSQQANLSSPLTATGNFDIALPSVANMNSMHANDLNSANNTFGSCDAQTSAPSGFKSVAITTLLSQKGTTFVAENVNGSVTSFKGWWFANMAGTVTINANCLAFGKVNQSLVFKQGWNVMDFTYDGTSTSVARAANQTPGRLIWKNKNDVQSLSSQALNPYLFNPWAALKK